MTVKRSLPILTAALAVLAMAVCAPAAPKADRPAGDPGFRIDAPTEGKPYTHLNFHNKAENFQFVVMGDRTGGARRGVFEDAIRKINQLQPEFVLSVGDLIGGYTTDTVKVNREWDELDGLVEQIQMPYFFVPGNHDLSNPVMVDIYKQRRGRPWYHFVYHDVLFLVVSTENPYPAKLGDDQLAYFREVLKDNPDPRWTLVFMHEPLWRVDQTEAWRIPNHDPQWDKFEEMMKGRRYTLFAGHTHSYMASKRNGGHDHLVLATTGGGSSLRGARMYGEFDHVAWVTMTENGPLVTNLALDGILMPDFRTEETAALVDGMLASALRGSVIRPDGDEFTSGGTQIVLANTSKQPLSTRVDLIAPAPLRVQPEVVQRDLAPGAKESVPVSVSAPAGTRVGDLVAPVLARYTTTLKDSGLDEPLEVTGQATIGVDPIRTVKAAPDKVTVDGKLDEWPALALEVRTAEPPDTTWKGPEDASFRMDVARDDAFLYLAIRTRDDKVILDGKRWHWEQDGVEFRVDARPDPERSRGRAANDFVDHLIIGVSPADGKGNPAVVFRADELPAGTRVAAVATEDGIAAEAAIPVAWLDAQQKGDWSAVRVNACMHDHDVPEQGASKHLFWRPDWRFDRNVEGSGTFTK